MTKIMMYLFYDLHNHLYYYFPQITQNVISPNDAKDPFPVITLMTLSLEDSKGPFPFDNLDDPFP